MTHFLISLAILATSFSKTEFYKILEDGSTVQLVEFEKKLNSLSTNETQQAYLGTLNMKLSESQKTPAEKVKLFKTGKAQLEKSISSDSKNVEYRFLRLIIQENAPKVLKYNLQIKEDSDLISSNLKTVNSELKSIIQDYSKTSKNLKI